MAFDAVTGIFQRVVVGQDPTNLYTPSSMTIGFGGDLFVASQSTGKVLRYNAVSGAPKGNSPGSPVFLDSLPGPTGLWFDASNDRLFVSNLGNSDATIVKIFNSAGNEIGTIDGGPAGGRTGMVLAGGDLYVNSFSETGFGPGESGAVLKFAGPDFTGPPQVLIAGDNDFDPSEPIVAGMFGLTIDGNGNLYSASLFGQEVIRLTTAGMVTGILSAQNPPNMANPPTAYPAGFLIDGNSLLVATMGNNNAADPIYGSFLFPGSVQKFDLTSGVYTGTLVWGGDALNQDPNVGFQATSLLLRETPTPGDFDGDGDVNGVDFVVWQTNFPADSGKILADGDADGDGDVDGADFVVWQTHFPQTQPGSVSSLVPEPATWLLSACYLAAWAVRRLQRKQ
ncbi:MAG: hypothetical protein IT427_13660 [Pirellulales bacterium]|nr:hypothetical protein [Pirellulales bacterium]